MSNANNGFTGWLKKNPGMAIGGFLFIVALIAVIVFIANRGSKGSTGPGAAAPSKPVIQFGDAQVILKPDAAGTTSNYRMFEYAEGAPGTFSGGVSPANIDLTVNWTNGAGFAKNKVIKLVLKRFIGTEQISEPIEVTDTSAISDFGSGSETFLGADLSVNKTGVGRNIIKVYYVVDGSTDEVELATSSEIEITQAMLDTTVNLQSITTLTVPVTQGSTLTASITENPVFTKYSIQHKEGGWSKTGLRMKVLSDGQVQFTDDSGTTVNLWSGSPTSFFISDYMGDQMIHDGVVSSDNYWTYPGTGDALESAASSVVFKTQSELNKALFKIAVTPTTTPTPAAATATHTIIPSSGDMWVVDTEYKSPDKSTTLVQQGDGLVIYTDGGARWGVTSGSSKSTYRAKFYNGHFFVWDTATDTKVKTIAYPREDSTLVLALYNDGSLTINDASGNVVTTVYAGTTSTYVEGYTMHRY